MSLLNFLAESVDVFTGSFSNSDLTTLMDTVRRIGNLLTNVILVVLAVVLIVKGALLGVQIVKAADEPQVRQEKIGSLKWLVIGCCIGFGITAAAKLLIPIITNELEK